jgi:predicted transcriptional regulator
MQTDALLISVKPEYADKIFAGAKTVELRRTRPRLLKGDLVLIYVTSPIKALAGACEVVEVIEGTPEALWGIVQDQAGVSVEEFCEYYAGAAIGFGIHLNNARRLPEPFHLEELRTEWPSFHPPQSYRYLSPEQVSFVGIEQRAGLIAALE